MVRYFLRTVYNSVLYIMILLGEAVTNSDFVAFKHVITLVDWPLYSDFGEGSNSALFSEILANHIIRYIRKLLENDEILYQNVYVHRGL